MVILHNLSHFLSDSVNLSFRILAQPCLGTYESSIIQQSDHSVGHSIVYMSK